MAVASDAPGRAADRAGRSDPAPTPTAQRAGATDRRRARGAGHGPAHRRRAGLAVGGGPGVAAAGGRPTGCGSGSCATCWPPTGRPGRSATPSPSRARPVAGRDRGELLPRHGVVLGRPLRARGAAGRGVHRRHPCGGSGRASALLVAETPDLRRRGRAPTPRPRGSPTTWWWPSGARVVAAAPGPAGPAGRGARRGRAGRRANADAVRPRHPPGPVRDLPGRRPGVADLVRRRPARVGDRLRAADQPQPPGGRAEPRGAGRARPGVGPAARTRPRRDHGRRLVGRRAVLAGRGRRRVDRRRPPARARAPVPAGRCAGTCAMWAWPAWRCSPRPTTILSGGSRPCTAWPTWPCGSWPTRTVRDAVLDFLAARKQGADARRGLAVDPSVPAGRASRRISSPGSSASPAEPDPLRLTTTSGKLWSGRGRRWIFVSFR